MNKCKWCNKETKNNKYCSHKCQFKFFEKHKLGFWSTTLQKTLNKRANKIIMQKHPNQFREMGIKAQIIFKKLNKGFYNKEVQKLGGRNSGPISIMKLRLKKGYIFNNIHFDSMKEMEIGMCIHYQIEKIKETINYQKKIGNMIYDFFVNKIFIEYHPPLYFFHKDETPKRYYSKRRNNLNKFGYRDYPLIVIK